MPSLHKSTSDPFISYHGMAASSSSTSVSSSTALAASPSKASSSSSGYVCDTLPAPRLASATTAAARDLQPPPSVKRMDHSPHHEVDEKKARAVVSASTSTPPAGRKLCVRHQRMADEGTNMKLQQSLDGLSIEERESISAVWSNFSASPHPRRAIILQGLLTMCCFSQLSMLSEQLGSIIRLDPFSVLPGEVAIRILGYLDATSLCRAAQVSRRWKVLADDDMIWRGICEQHIGQKCAKCGWGLPVLEKKRLGRTGSSSATATFSSVQQQYNHHHHHHHQQQQLSGAKLKKRELESLDPSDPSYSQYESGQRSAKRQRAGSNMVNAVAGPGPSSSSFRSMSSSSSSSSVDAFASSGLSPSSMDEGEHSSSSSLLISNTSEPLVATTRPWKDVYSERLTVERNWRRGRYKVRTLKGHTDGVMCMQFSESLSHPSFPILITGSYDRTVRVWNMDTGQEVLVMRGHTRAVRALQFDEAKLITGSMDHTIKVWDWRKGRCIRTLEGHTEGVVCLNYDSNVLASGSVDATIKVWNFRTGEAFTLRGHCDWVNSVQLWDSTSSAPISSTALAPPSSCSGSSSPMHSNAGPNIDPGKMLFSASDDGTIRLWDLTMRSCVRQYSGHVAQVQSMKLLVMDEGCSDAVDESHSSFAATVSSQGSSSDLDANTPTRSLTPSAPLSGLTLDDVHSTTTTTSSSGRTPVLISGSLDNTIKFWDINTGKVLRTLFGHIEGVWAVASDRLRLVSGSHDRTIKVWAHENGKCTGTLVGHTTPVTCLSLGEDKIVSGSEDGEIRIWNFS